MSCWGRHYPQPCTRTGWRQRFWRFSWPSASQPMRSTNSTGGRCGPASPSPVLVVLGVGGLVGAVVIGLIGAVLASPWLLAFVAFGAFMAPAYNLEWFRGRFHTDFWFAVAWGAFPFLTAYFASAERFEAPVHVGAAAVFALSLSPAYSQPRGCVRYAARFAAIEGRAVYADGSVEDIDRRWAISRGRAGANADGAGDYGAERVRSAGAGLNQRATSPSRPTATPSAARLLRGGRPGW